MFDRLRRRHSRIRQRHEHNSMPKAEVEQKLERDERRFKGIDERGNSVYEVGGWNGGVAFEEVIDHWGHRFIDVNPAHPLSVNTEKEAVMAKPVRVYAGDRDKYGSRRVGRDAWGSTCAPKSKTILAATFDTLSEAWHFMENSPLFSWDRGEDQLTFSCITSSDRLDAEKAEACRAARGLIEGERQAKQDRWNAAYDRERRVVRRFEKAQREHEAAQKRRAKAILTATSAFAGANEITARAA